MVEYYFQPHSSWQQFPSDKKHTLKKIHFLLQKFNGKLWFIQVAWRSHFYKSMITMFFNRFTEKCKCILQVGVPWSTLNKARWKTPERIFCEDYSLKKLIEWSSRAMWPHLIWFWTLVIWSSVARNILEVFSYLSWISLFPLQHQTQWRVTEFKAD